VVRHSANSADSGSSPQPNGARVSGVGPNNVPTQAAFARPPSPATRERLLGLLFRARSELGAVLERLNETPARSDVLTARAIGEELDEAQRALTYLRDPAALDWAAILRRVATACSGELAGVRERLMQAAAQAEALRSNGTDARR